MGKPAASATPKPGRRNAAVKAGPAGKQWKADGSAHSAPNPKHWPNPHGKTDGGRSGLKGS